VAGLSLGEYTALVHAKVLSFEDGLKVFSPPFSYIPSLLYLLLPLSLASPQFMRFFFFLSVGEIERRGCAKNFRGSAVM
jgi:hypothetical protein